jgi:hypothetical protein
MGAGASAGGGGGGGGGGKVKVKQSKRREAVEADPVADALVPAGWLRVLRGDNIEGFVRIDQKRQAGKLPGYYAEKAVAWHLTLADAREGKEAVGVIPKGSGLIGLELTPIDPTDLLKQQYTRFLAEISPRVEGLDPSLLLRADPASITDEEEQRPEEFQVVEAWVRVSAKPSALEGLMRTGGMAATVVEISSANKPWPVPTMLEPVPEPQPPEERSAEDLLNSGLAKFEEGEFSVALAEYKEAAKAAELNLYMLRTRKQLLLGNGTGAAFRKSRDMMDRSIHHAQELTLWRAVREDEDWIQMENELWLPKLALVLVSTPLDQMVIRAMATAGWLGAALALDDFEEATVAYNQFSPDGAQGPDGLKLHTFVERRPVAQALAAYELHKPKPTYGYDESWKHYRAVRDHAASHAEDLALKMGDVVAVAASGQHETGWWEGFLSNGEYGLLPSHAVEPLPAADATAMQQQMEGWRPIRYPDRVQFVTPMADHVASKGRRPAASEALSPPGSPPTDGTVRTRGSRQQAAGPAAVTDVSWKSQLEGGSRVDVGTAVVRARVAEPLDRVGRRRGARQQVITARTPWPYQTTHIPQINQAGADLSSWPPEETTAEGQILFPAGGADSPRASSLGAAAVGTRGDDVAGARFTDPDFPAGPTSLAGGWEEGDGGPDGGRWLCNPPLAHDVAERYKSITWARASLLRADTDKAERAVLNQLSRSLPLLHPRNALTGKGTALPSDVVAGEGESSFLSVLVVLARRTPVRIERLIKSLGFGRYAVRFQDFGRDCTIDVDEFLPCVRKVAKGASSGELLEGGALAPVFGQITSGVLWAALMEKAWAKYYRIGDSSAAAAGTYHTVNGMLSDPGDALGVLTGAPVDYRTCSTARKSETAEQMWQYVRDGITAGYVVCAGTGGSRERHAEELKILGLEPLRAYAVASAVEVKVGAEKSQRLIQLRSPSGNTAWKGAWGPESELWTSDVRKDMTGKCDTGAEQGCFWMAWDEFIVHFHGVYVCRCRADWERAADTTRILLEPSRVRDDVVYSLAEDSEEYDEQVKAALESAKRLQVGRGSWTGVAYFHIVVPPGYRSSSRKSLIAVSQRDLRALHQSRGGSYCAIEFRVLGGTDEQLETRGHTLIGRSDCYVGKDVWLECELEPGAEYMVVAEVSTCGDTMTASSSAMSDGGLLGGDGGNGLRGGNGAAAEDGGMTGRNSIELSASCWREGTARNNGAYQDQQQEEEDDRMGGGGGDEAWFASRDGLGTPKSPTRDRWVPSCGAESSRAELAADLWGPGSEVAVRAVQPDEAWDRLSKWYSQRIAVSIGDGQPYDLGKEGDTVGLPYWSEWACEEEKVVALRYVNRSGSVVIRENLRWRLGGMRVVGCAQLQRPASPSNSLTSSQQQDPSGNGGGSGGTSVDVVIEPGDQALLVVQGAVLGVPTAHEYERAITLDFVETNT